MVFSSVGASRLFILDPTCINDYGHNFLSGVEIARVLSSRLLLPVVFCVSRLFRGAGAGGLGENISLETSFHHYYLREMPVAADVALDGDHDSLLDCSQREYLSRRRAIAIRDLDRLLDAHSISASDIIFYPNIDFVSLSALLCVLRARGISGFPRLAIRFIGVFEYPSELEAASLESLLGALLQFASAGLRLVLSAESVVLARRLQDLYGITVRQTPTLSGACFQPLPAAEVIQLFVPGSGRPDKGFFRIASICRELSRALSVPFLLLAQDMPVYRYGQMSSADLLPIDSPEVVLLPSSLSDAYLYSLMKSSHIILLPYDKKVYQLRSSAIMADAACMGRPLVASDCCGFSADIARFSLGSLANSDSDFARRAGTLIDSYQGADQDRWSHSSAQYRQFSVDALLGFVSVLV